MNSDDLARHVQDLEERGWTHVPAVYRPELCQRIKDSFARAEPEFLRLQAKKGISHLVEHATHHTLVLCREMLDLLEKTDVNDVVEAWFGGKYILSTMGLSYLPPEGRVYTQRIHRDQRSFSGNARMWLNTLVMLDDSTEDNGATWMLEGSQDRAERPEEEYFYAHAVRALGKAGDVLLFDGNIWHAAGTNTTSETRHIITPIYCRPFIKQQLDYPRAFGYDFGRTLSPHLQQVLGYRALVPATLDEFYQKDEDRFYQSDQG